MNETFDLIFNLSVNLLQGVAFVLFCNCFLIPKFNKTINAILCSSVVLLLFGSITIINFLGIFASYVEIIANFLIMIPFSVLCHKGKLYIKFLLPVISFLLLMCVSLIYTTFVSVIFNRNIEQTVTESTVYRYIYVIVANLTYAFILHLIVRIYKNKINLKKPIDIIMFFVIPALTMIITVLATAVTLDTTISEVSRIYLGAIMLIAIIISFSIFSLMHRISKTAEISALNTVMTKEQEMYKSEIINQSRYIEDVSKVKHEMKNKLFCINELINTGKLTEAQKVCEDAENQIGKIAPVFKTNNLYLNALLNMTHNKAVINDIKFYPTIKSSLLGIDGTDLISLLGNLIDNAIEALESIEVDRLLQITIFEKDNYYMFTVRNSISESVMLHNPSLETTKKDKNFHGHGLKIVNEIVKKYNGTISYSENNNRFEVMCMLEKKHS